ncbi:hypothetical protein JCM18694_25670 [Prolixibacter denitrificans]|uniref:Uncharacterized protein n=2 Tax=Prolixibacter denitrificans TaxID=1541063 RepID=A0ABQ0ZLK7_9BACT|nr:hypothetical protein JCM18694_25670 [Prolixibacter denitrificans]
MQVGKINGSIKQKAMKNRFKILYTLLGLTLLFSACTPDNYELGALLSKSDLNFTIEPSSANPNDIVLTSLTPNVTPLWTTPFGRSIKVVDTINVAFPGDYTFKYGVESAGGYVQADSVQVSINTLDQNAVSGDMWTNISGGYGKEKTWYLDLDANGVSKIWAGPIYFYGTNDSWLSVTDGVAVGGDSWNWSPDWSGNQWLCAATDFGSMTFNLKDGPYVQVDHTSTPDGITMGGQQSGTYMLDTKNHTITLNDVTLIHPINYHTTLTKSWTGKFKIMALTADKMMIGVLRDPVISGQGACIQTLNFVSKAYYDSH